MAWSFSFQLIPGEEVIEDSTKRTQEVVKSAYSVFVTDRRVIFRFDGLGSHLSNAFFYKEIVGMRPVKRLFVNYLLVKTRIKESLFNVPEPEYWAKKIMSMKEGAVEPPEGGIEGGAVSTEMTKRALLDMLTVLYKNGILTGQEFEDKVNLLDAIK